MAIYKVGKNWYIDFTFKGERIRESIDPSRKGAEKVITKKKAEVAETKLLPPKGGRFEFGCKPTKVPDQF